MKVNKSALSSFLRIFKKIPIDIVDVNANVYVNTDYGILHSRIKDEYKDEFDLAVQEVYVKTKKLNDTFHKSFLKIVETNQRHLWYEAVAHYMTTYGFEALGVDANGYVYLPDEICDVPELKKFLYIPTITKEEIIERIESILSSGIALSKQMLEDIITIITLYNVELNFENVKNKEAQIILMHRLNYVPENPEQKIRLINYLLTGNTLLIKSHLSVIKWKIVQLLPNDRKYVDKLFEDEVGLASVFYRYKPLFLALKKNDEFGSYRKKINKIRRLAVKYHKPIQTKKYLTTKIKEGLFPNEDILRNMSVYEMATIYNELAHYLNSEEYVKAYVIRNGSVYVDENAKQIDKNAPTFVESWLNMIKSVIRRRYENYDIEVKLPENFDIAFPTSEKSFIGSIPLYSTINLDESASVVGVQWENTNTGQRVDIDLSAITDSNKKVGWDSYYRNENNSIIFSGDMTSGPAAESFFINEPVNAMMQVNLFNVNEAEYQLFFSRDSKDAWKNSGRQYTTDPNKIIYSEKLYAETRSETIGIYSKDEDKSSFSFAKLSLGDSITSLTGKVSQNVIKYLKEKSKYALKLSDIFNVVEEFSNESKSEEDYDETILEYDLTNLDKSTILELVEENK